MQHLLASASNLLVGVTMTNIELTCVIVLCTTETFVYLQCLKVCFVCDFPLLIFQKPLQISRRGCKNLLRNWLGSQQAMDSMNCLQTGRSEDYNLKLFGRNIANDPIWMPSLICRGALVYTESCCLAS